MSELLEKIRDPELFVTACEFHNLKLCRRVAIGLPPKRGEPDNRVWEEMDQADEISLNERSWVSHGTCPVCWETKRVPELLARKAARAARLARAQPPS